MEDDKLQFLLQWQQEASKVCRRALSLQRRSAAAPQHRSTAARSARDARARRVAGAGGNLSMGPT